MPIQLEELTNAVVAPAPKALTTKFFSSELTGLGKTAGLLNETVRPGRYQTGASKHTMSQTALNTKARASGNGITLYNIPTCPLTQYSLQNNLTRGITLPVPFDTDRFEITQHATTLGYDVFLDMTPQGMSLTKDETREKTARELDILYRMEIYVLAKGSTSERVRLTSTAPFVNAAALAQNEEYAMVDWSYAPLDDIEDFIATATKNIAQNGISVHVNIDDLAEWMTEFDVYERTLRQAYQWTGMEIADIISQHITELFANGVPDVSTLNHLALQLRYLETYNVSLEAYRAIHTTINAVSPIDIASDLSKQNLNLLMSHTLEQLNTLRDQLEVPPAQYAAQAATLIPQHYSLQQKAAITSAEPLTLVQAGAGTGKSTVILGRIQHLVNQGVNPADITVLSFTNAAADNITEKNPQVGSMTIARMIHDIYSLNHPTHELSQIDTILNTLDFKFPNDDLARSFRRVLVNIDKLEPGSMTMLNAFIEANRDGVMNILDTVKQTCLELEIVLAYQQIDNMVEPPHVRSRYLIIDEVQDNSIFEFIYLLKYVTKHRENMFIVGDASQTLYEFRASNPRALNALEESGVFQTFQLTTNYRSNQEILDFANVHLADIEANHAAQLQLQANSLVSPTANSFQNKVKLHHELVDSVRKIREHLPSLLNQHVFSWVEKKLAAGEKVAFLTYARDEVKVMEKAIQERFPNELVANLVSDRPFATTVFSSYIKLFWNDVIQVDPSDAAFVVYQGVNTNLAQITRNADKAVAAVAKMTTEWWQASSADINGWLGLYQAGQMTRDEFFARLQENVLNYEIKHNGIKQSLMNQKNRERKERNLQANSRLVVSTIHGAKGLEFDNTVVLHKYDPQMSEPNKRMYYVAFTRAMKGEFVLSYSTNKNPRIESDYKLIVEVLKRNDAIISLRQQGVDLDLLSEEELEEAIASASFNLHSMGMATPVAA